MHIKWLLQAKQLALILYKNTVVNYNQFYLHWKFGAANISNCESLKDSMRSQSKWQKNQDSNQNSLNQQEQALSIISSYLARHYIKCKVSKNKHTNYFFKFHIHFKLWVETPHRVPQQNVGITKYMTTMKNFLSPQ